jgi:hypothetical protein
MRACGLLATLPLVTMRACGLCAALLLLTAPGAALRAGADHEAVQARKTAAHSFLFSDRELGLLEAARAGRPGEPPAAVVVARPRPAPPTATIHLGAILYHAPDDWRVWLNGQSFTPSGPAGPIEILKVTAERVVLAWRKGQDSPPTRIELRPNQTYLTASGQVVEGRLELRR